MKKPKVVFDTNIFISKLLTPGGGSHKLVGLFLRGRLELFTTKGQIAELVEVALRVNQESSLLPNGIL